MAAKRDVFDTMSHYTALLVSLGAGYEFCFKGSSREFADSAVKPFSEFDTKNLFMCNFLNIRGSSFSTFKADSLISLIYIDIAFS